MITFLAFLVAALLDPLALVVCVGLGVYLKSYWKSALAGAIAYLVLILIIPGVRLYALVVVTKILAGALLGALGAVAGKWISRGKKQDSTTGS